MKEEVEGMFNISVISAFIVLVLFTAWLLFVRHPEKHSKRLSNEPERRYDYSIQQLEAQYESFEHTKDRDRERIMPTYE